MPIGCKVYAHVAYTVRTRSIGKKNTLPWKSGELKGDMQWFKSTTTTTRDINKQNVVIMGRKTWESLNGHTLLNRVNVVITRNPPHSLCIPSHHPANLHFRSDLLAAVLEFSNYLNIESVYVIGGGEIYAKAFELELIDEVYATEVYQEFDGCDSFFPLLPTEFILKNVLRKESAYELVHYKKVTKRMAHEEYQYLDLVKEILTNGEVKSDRTGTGTKSVFGRTMRFSLRNGTMPLLTTKRTFWRGVATELLWFISGNTNSQTLTDQNVNIWDGHGSRSYLDSIGLTHREEGDLGPIYGFQWRHFGAEYGTMHDDYDGKGVDQLMDLIAMIKHDPNSRRLILTAWNPMCLKEMALPPCHVLCQFYVSMEKGELSCQLYQRSADMGLGVPFNIASYALLTRLIAQCCGLKCGELIHVIGDCHVYLNHQEALNEQLGNTPTEFPTLKINTDNMDIDKFKFEDFELINYKPHNAIKMKMAV